MPINAFGGGPGSGKTYGVMEHIILPAVAKGRFIITNISGLNDEAIYAYVAEHFYKGKIICIGHIRRCDHDAPNDDDFFPGSEHLDTPSATPKLDDLKVCGGDLVVIDEATRYWNSDAKVKRQHAYFFREHRHFANELGHTCDLVVIDPDLSMLARALKGKVELASITHKPKEIGLNRYVVNLYRGVRTTGKPTSTMGPYKFQKAIFSLYKSYSHAAAKEQVIDKRQNLLNNPRVLIYAAGMFLLLCASVWGLYSYYRHQVEKFSTPQAEVRSTARAGSEKKNTAFPAAQEGNLFATDGDKSSNLRVAGEVRLKGQSWIVVVDDAGAVRLENPSAFVGQGTLIVGSVEGKRVATWTGGRSGSPTITGVQK